MGNFILPISVTVAFCLKIYLNCNSSTVKKREAVKTKAGLIYKNNFNNRFVQNNISMGDRSMTLIHQHKSYVVKLIMILMAVSMLSACGSDNSNTSIDSTVQEETGEKAQWSFKWNEGAVWQ